MERRRILVVAAALVACLGVALVLLYVRGADNRAQAQYSTTKVLTALQEIEPGESIAEAAASGKLALKSVITNDVLPGAQTSTASLAGDVATTAIYPGEQIIAAKFGTSITPTTALEIPKGLSAVSVNLTDAGRVAGFVEPGSSVSIYVNGNDPASGKPFDRMLIPKIEVLGVGSTTSVATTTTSGEQTTTEQLSNTLLTLAVTEHQAEKVLFAEQNGTLSFALLTPSSVVDAAGPTTYSNLFG